MSAQQDDEPIEQLFARALASPVGRWCAAKVQHMAQRDPRPASWTSPVAIADGLASTYARHVARRTLVQDGDEHEWDRRDRRDAAAAAVALDAYTALCAYADPPAPVERLRSDALTLLSAGAAVDPARWRIFPGAGGR